MSLLHTKNSRFKNSSSNGNSEIHAISSQNLRKKTPKKPGINSS